MFPAASYGWRCRPGVCSAGVKTLNVAGELSMRRRRVQIGFIAPALLGKRLETGFTIYGQRFQYDQGRESSILAFDRDIPMFTQFAPDNVMNYVAYSYGVEGFARYRSSKFSTVGVTYGYDVSSYKPLTGSTNEHFSFTGSLPQIADRQNLFESFPNVLSNIRTGKLTPEFRYSTIDHPVRPTRGFAVQISSAIASSALGSEVNTWEPAFEAKYFHPGLKNGHVVALRLRGNLITGYAGKRLPPFDRYYMGGEDEVRGFDSWSIGPIAFMPSAATVLDLNNDGTPILRRVFDASGNVTLVNVTQNVPAYKLISPGGDTKVISNFEYRIPLRGPFMMALFTDAGENRLTFRHQLDVSGARINALNSEFPEASFRPGPLIVGDTQKIRVSTGIEFQVVVPKLRAPVRLYWAYNPIVYRANIQPPIVADRAYFPNLATFQEAGSTIAAATAVLERRSMFRISIGRTF